MVSVRISLMELESGRLIGMSLIPFDVALPQHRKIPVKDCLSLAIGGCLLQQAHDFPELFKNIWRACNPHLFNLSRERLQATVAAAPVVKIGSAISGNPFHDLYPIAISTFIHHHISRAALN